MIPLTIAALAVLAAIMQIGAVPAAFAEPLTGPVLPVALLAGWAAVRHPREVWPVPLAAAAVLGVVSEGRVGLFALALLPGLVLVTLVRLRERRGEATALRRLGLAAAGGATGALSYVLLLAAAGGTLDAVLPVLSSLLVGTAWTATLATVLAAALWPVRTGSGGLFA